jgi:DNA-binding transcriptional ArsR family regulator
MENMSHIRREGINFLINLIQSNPGRMADFYIGEVIKAYGVKRETASEWLKSLADAGLIEAHGTRIYPRGYQTEEEKKLEDSLLAYLRRKVGEDVKPLTAPVKPLTEQKTPERYLLIYDMKADIPASEVMRIYRRLNKVYHQILEEGRYALRIQFSVWETETKEDAYRLASCLPSDKTRIKIYKIIEVE